MKTFLKYIIHASVSLNALYIAFYIARTIGGGFGLLLTIVLALTLYFAYQGIERAFK